MSRRPIKQEGATSWQMTKVWLANQILKTLPYPTTRFDGQTIIVTGANTGLGYEAARHFVRLGAGKVILAVRSISKGKESAKDITESENGPRVVEVWQLNLESYASVKEFAARGLKLDRLDVVVANAGVYPYNFASAEQDETTITVNVVSTFLLAILLLPKLRQTAAEQPKPSVVTFVGSFVHCLTTFPEGDAEQIFTELVKEKSARMQDRRIYNVSKSMQLLIVRELASRLSASSKAGEIITSIINPGFLNTTIMRHNHSVLFIGLMLFWRRIAGRSPEEGSRTLVYAAYGGKDTHGMYLDNCEVGKTGEWIANERGTAIQKKLWEELGKKLESIESGVMGLI